MTDASIAKSEWTSRGHQASRAYTGSGINPGSCGCLKYRRGVGARRYGAGMTSYMRNVPASEATCPKCGGALKQEMIRTGIEEAGEEIVRHGMYSCEKGDFNDYNLPEKA